MSNDEANKVRVTVGAGGAVSCNPDPVPARGKNVHIKFDLVTAGYVFADTDAIVVSNPGTQFPEPSKTKNGGSTATILDKNTERGQFKYTVRLKDSATGRLIEFDPTINNED